MFILQYCVDALISVFTIYNVCFCFKNFLIIEVLLLQRINKDGESTKKNGKGVELKKKLKCQL